MTPSITAELPEPMSHRVRNAVGRFALGVAVLGLAIAVSPGLQAESPLAVVVAAVWCALVGSVLRPCSYASWCRWAGGAPSCWPCSPTRS